MTATVQVSYRIDIHSVRSHRYTSIRRMSRVLYTPSQPCRRSRSGIRRQSLTYRRQIGYKSCMHVTSLRNTPSITADIRWSGVSHHLQSRYWGL